MPYFKRESAARIVSNLPVAPPWTASPQVEEVVVQSAVERATAILDDETNRKKHSYPWPGDMRAIGNIGEHVIGPVVQSSTLAIASFLADAARGASAVAARDSHSPVDVPALPAHTTTPGGKALVRVTVANDVDVPVSVTFLSTGLVSGNGDSLSPDAVTFHPPRATIPAQGQEVIEIRIAVPDRSRAGIYTGLVMSTGDDPIRAVVTVQVE